MRRLKSLICKEDGAAIVEFAISAAILFSMFFGIIEFCMVVYAANSVVLAAEQGARYAMVRGSDWTDPCTTTTSFGCATGKTNVINYIQSQTYPGINLGPTSNATITVTPLTTRSDTTTCVAWSQGCRIEVQIQYSYGLSLPYLPAASSSIPLTGTSIETIQD